MVKDWGGLNRVRGCITKGGAEMSPSLHPLRKWESWPYSHKELNSANNQTYLLKTADGDTAL